MDLFILGDDKRVESIVEDYISLIWTERYSGYGEFELIVKSEEIDRNRFQRGMRLVLSESNRVMEIELISNSESDDGERKLTIKGRSLEYYLTNRLARNMVIPPTPWQSYRSPTEMARNLYREVCHTPTNGRDVRDIFPEFLINQNPVPGSMPEPQEKYEYSIEIKPLYDAIKEVLDPHDVGFGIFRNRNTGSLTFRVYTGFDRTSAQSNRPAVIFSPQLNNLKNTDEVSSTVDYKNVCYVFNDQGYMHVSIYGNATAIEGMARRLMFVKADNLKAGYTQQQLSDYLKRVGRDALLLHRPVEAFDGEIDQYNGYRYGVDYGLGDMVEYHSEDGHITKMLVTEQIFVSDGEGQRSYPTLTLHQNIQPNTWLAWGGIKEWDDMTAEEWGTLP